MKKLSIRIIPIFFLVLVFCNSDVVYAINVLGEGYRVLPSVPTTIDTTPIGGDCKIVVTPNDGKDRFVPTKTLAEWNFFKSAAPSLGIALNPCLAPFTLASVEGKGSSWFWGDVTRVAIIGGKVVWNFGANDMTMPWPINTSTMSFVVPTGPVPMTVWIRREGIYYSDPNGSSMVRYSAANWCPWNSTRYFNCGGNSCSSPVCLPDGTWLHSQAFGVATPYINLPTSYTKASPPPIE